MEIQTGYARKLNKLAKEPMFKQKLKLILKKLDDNNCKCALNNNKLTITNDLKNETNTITLNNKSIEYHTYLTKENDLIESSGKIYKSNKIVIVKYINSKITTYEKCQNIETITSISLFDSKTLTENFKYTATEYKNYEIINGKKQYIKLDDNGYGNVYYNAINIRAQKRTTENNLIESNETKFYNDNLKKYNKKTYCIGYNIQPNSSYIPYGGSFMTIPNEVYLDFINGKISEKNLFEEHYKPIRSNILKL